MKILSFDVGLKNLAYCLFDIDLDHKYLIEQWNIIDLCNEESHKCQSKTKKKSCTKNAKYTKNNEYFCKMHAKKQDYLIPISELEMPRLKKCKINELHIIFEKYNFNYEKPITKKLLLEKFEQYRNENMFEIIKKKNADKIDLITIGINMKDHFDKLFRDTFFDHIIIENQISPIANRMKTLQGMIAQYFIMKDSTNIHFVSSQNKLKDYVDNGKKMSYSERKKNSIIITKNLIEENQKINEWNNEFDKSKKKDDLADCFLQGLWYLRKENLVE